MQAQDMKSSRYVRIIDQWGWAYHFIAKEHAKWSRFNIVAEKFTMDDFTDVALVYIHSPNIWTPHIKRLCAYCKDNGIPIVGQYSGEPKYWNKDVQQTYDHIDLAVGISPETYEFCRKHYSCPVVFMPEPVDADYFTCKTQLNNDGCISIGWAGGMHKDVKRFHLLKKLRCPVKIQSEWSKDTFVEDRNQDNMVNFYNNIDVLVLTSVTECQPRVVLEAMACGRAVVATDVGNMRMLLDERWIVPVEPVEAMVDQMNDRLSALCKDRELLQAVGIRNRRHLENHFSWKNTVHYWDMLFEGMATKNIDMAKRASIFWLKKHEQPAPFIR